MSLIKIMSKNFRFLILIIIFFEIIVFDNAFAVSDVLFNADINTIALWRLNESELNPVIDGAGVNNGTAVGTAIQAGKFGNARYFGGYGNYIVVPDNASLRNLSQITIESWVYPTGFDLGCWANNESFVQKGKGDQSNAYSLKIWRNQEDGCASANNFNQLNFNGNFGGGSLSTRWFEPNQWYYVVLTYDGSYLKIYINGTLETISAYSPNLTVTTLDPLYINRHTWAGGYGSSYGRMQGLIDEIRISKIARSAEEIAYYYNLANRPSQFWSQIQNSFNGWMNIRKTPGIINKTNDDIIKTIPNGWVVRVASTTDANGADINLDGYHWYKIEDATDETIGWMAVKSLSNNVEYLSYDVSSQTLLEQKAAQLSAIDQRKSAILQAVDSYYAASTTNSLYSPSGGLDNNNNFSKFIQGSNFPKELVLAIAAQESGGVDFDNERCSQSKDGGIGVFQITSVGFKGLGSALDNLLHKNDCNLKTGWFGDISKYYSNAFQGIYANIKDGFRVLQEKYRQQCPKNSIFKDGYEFTCQDIEKILTVWGYNGFAADKNIGLYTGNYLKYISEKLNTLSSYFYGIVYGNSDNLIQKLAIANNHKQVIKVYSPVNLYVSDSQNRITGYLNGQIKEEIPNSLYDQENEGVAIFFPENLYKYDVIGNNNGVYGLSINSDNNASSIEFRAVDIPVSVNEKHEYIVDESALSRGEKGVLVKVDKNGDGVFDYQFHASKLLQDNTAPTTTISLSGTQGLNNWHVSDVQIVLSANNNENGVGILKTEYSFDNGATWNVYSNPFILFNEGINHILYRSQDFLGNLEEIKLLEIKIDKTAPEAVIYFNKDNQKLKIEGIDNLTVNPVVFVIKDNKKDNIVYQVKDEAGNTIKLYFDKFKQEGKQIKAELKTIQYNNNEIINLSEVKLKYEWLTNKDGIIKELEQNIKIKDKFEVWAKYSHQKNETEIKIKKENEKEIKQILLGLAIIELITKSGEISFGF